MTSLRDRKCAACSPGTPPLPAARASELLGQLAPDWRLADDGGSLKRSFGFDDFYRTMAFVNAVAWVANVEDHHPDLEVVWGKCTVKWSTHAVDGLTENDFICAAKVDQLLV